MDETDLFVHHGGQNSTMEGSSCGIPMVVCPTFADQPVNAAKLTKLNVAISVARPTTGGESVEAYRAEVATAVSSIIDNEEAFAMAALELKKEVVSGGGEEAAEKIILQAIKDGV